jgi:hypothetical protein
MCAKQAWTGRMTPHELKSRFVPQRSMTVRQRCSDQPVPSVAWSTVTLAAKRTQGVRSRVIEPRKPIRRESGARIYRRPQHRHPANARDIDLTGVEEHGARTEGHPGTWEVFSLPSKCGRVTRGTNPGSRSGSRSWRTNTRADDGTAVRRKRSTRGTSEKMSELRVVPAKWGNQPEGPHGGKATGAGHGNHWRER